MQIRYREVDTLPTTGVPNTMYLIKNGTSFTKTICDQNGEFFPIMRETGTFDGIRNMVPNNGTMLTRTHVVQSITDPEASLAPMLPRNDRFDKVLSSSAVIQHADDTPYVLPVTAGVITLSFEGKIIDNGHTEHFSRPVQLTTVDNNGTLEHTAKLYVISAYYGGFHKRAIATDSQHILDIRDDLNINAANHIYAQDYSVAEYRISDDPAWVAINPSYVLAVHNITCVEIVGTQHISFVLKALSGHCKASQTQAGGAMSEVILDPTDGATSVTQKFVNIIGYAYVGRIYAEPGARFLLAYPSVTGKRLGFIDKFNKKPI